MPVIDLSIMYIENEDGSIMLIDDQNDDESDDQITHRSVVHEFVSRVFYNVIATQLIDEKFEKLTNENRELKAAVSELTESNELLKRKISDLEDRVSAKQRRT